MKWSRLPAPSWIDALRLESPTSVANAPGSPTGSKLKQQHAWGDITDDVYQAQRDEVRAALAGLPGCDDRVAQFDAYRTRLLALPEAIALASPARREELCRIVLRGVTVRDREIDFD